MNGPSRAAEHATQGDLTPAQIRYMGRMAAVISHEIRNNLATINEKAGLIKDLIAMSARGRPLDEGRVARITEDVARRVAEATEVCERLSQLAHAPDTEIRTMALGSVVELVAKLMRRPASVSNTRFECLPAVPINVETRPVLLQFVIYCCLSALVEHSPGNTFELLTGGERRGMAFVRFSGPGARVIVDRAELSCEHALEALGASARVVHDDEVLLFVPTVLDAASESRKERSSRE